MPKAKTNAKPRAAAVSRAPMSARQGASHRARARYDAAQTNDDNRRHWAATDGFSADAANSLAVRKKLRERAGYEVANNSYLKGIISTLANDTVGTGPTLQMLIKGGDEPEQGGDGTNSLIEGLWSDWAREVRLAEKLRVMRKSRVERGEVFAVLTYNPAMASPIKLDVVLVEADQVTDPKLTSYADPLWCDGIQFDEYGNPVSYRILKHHPGSPYHVSVLEFGDVPARSVFHYFLCDRPGQRRGIPEITSALSIYPDLRRYCAAVIAAAETAAENAFTLETDATADDDDAPVAMDAIDLEKRQATFLPAGYKLNQTRAEQPTTTYNGFVDKKLAEAARCINVPFTIAALDSSQSNLSARYLDSQIYAKGIIIDRFDLEVFLDRILDELLTEMVHVTGDDGLPLLPRVPDRFPHAWFWPSTGVHADPDKVASAQGQELKNGTTTLARIYADKGQDWESEQQAAARAMGVTVKEYQALVRFAIFGKSDTSTPADGAVAGPDPALERLKAIADAAGVIIRAGLMTPQAEDEAFFRKQLDVPPAGPAVAAVWKENQTRYPITLVQPGAPKAGGGFGQQPSSDGEGNSEQ